MRVEHRALADLAASVADGVPVDWKTAELRGKPDEKRLVSHLRLVESIASLHRSIPGTDDAPVAPGPGGPHWGRLTLFESIGRGTSCDVFRAWDNELHREVAVKLLQDDGDHREAHARILEEARRLARVRHPHVVQVYGAERHEHRVGLWMELVRGESLEHIVAARGAFGAREAAAIGLDLCAALAAVHAAQLLHRDIKAQNVMREEGGRIVLMDFGTGEDLSGTNRLVGTPLYLAPEIFVGQKASVQSDLYSLGVTLFHLVTGKFPVVATTMEQLARAHAQGERQSLRDLRPDLPQGFIRVVDRALQPDPARRFRSAGEMESALRDAIDAPIAPAVVEPPVAPAARRRAVAFIAAAMVLLALAAGLSLWARSVQARRGAVLAAIRTIGVMPATTAGVLGSDGSSIPDHVARGFTDELLSTLGQQRGISIKSGGGAEGRTAPALARALDVDALLETTLSSTGGSGGAAGPITAQVRLVAAGSGQIVWSNRFERPRGETQGLQHDIAAAMANAIMPGSAAGQVSSPTNPAAEEAYLLGRMHLNHYGAGSADLALKAFDRARRIDSSHAGAYVGAARATISLGLNGTVPHPKARAEALSDVHRALELNPNLAEAQATLAHINFVYDWNWAEAERGFHRSLEANPSLVYARTFFAEHLAAMGRFDEATEQAAMATRLEPESGIAARRYALVHYYKRDFAAAEAARRVAAALEPNSPGVPLLEGRILEANGRYAEALAATERASQLSGGTGVPMRVELVRLEALSGRPAQAAARYAELERQAAARTIRLTDRDRGYIELALGNTDKGLEYFSRAVDERDPSMVWIGVDARLAPVRGDVRFKQLLATIGLPLIP